MPMDKELQRLLDEHLEKLEDFCIKTLAEVAIMRIQIGLIKTKD